MNGTPERPGAAGSESWQASRRGVLATLAGCGLLAAFPLAMAGEDVVARHAWLAAWVASGAFSRDWLNTTLAGLTPDRRVLDLMDNQAEAKPYHQYRELFINNRVVEQGRAMLVQHQQLLGQVEERFAVPGRVLVALWGIESRFGRNTGRHSVLRSLFTLAAHYPRRAEFFREELRHFLLLCREEGWAPREAKGSFAGAMGQVQMIPSTMRQYAVDFDGNGHRDVFNQVDDVLASIANYLNRHGWRQDRLYTAEVAGGWAKVPLHEGTLKDMRPWSELAAAGVRLKGEVTPDPEEPVGVIRLMERSGPRYHAIFNNFWVVTRWNRSHRFAMVVSELSGRLEEAG